MKTINLHKALEGVHEYWSPKIVGRVNDQYVKVAKLKGQLVWHKHDDEDELFQVITGRLVIQLEGQRHVELEAGDYTFLSLTHAARAVSDMTVAKRTFFAMVD